MTHKLRSIIATLFCASLLFIGCQAQEEEVGPAWHELAPVSKEHLESGMYYVKKTVKHKDITVDELNAEEAVEHATVDELGSIKEDDTNVESTLEEDVAKESDANSSEYYYPVYAGAVNFSGTTDRPSNSRLIKYTIDLEKIPVLYQGDQLILYSSVQTPGPVMWERFKDIGPTTGLSNIHINTVGYAYFAVDAFDSLYYSSAGDVLSDVVSDTEIVIEKFNGLPLKSSRISPVGTIMGLKKGKTYPADIYIGTNHYNIDITADTNVFHSWETYVSYDVEYRTEHYAVIHIPAYFEPGFYNVNGAGLFCYAGDVTEEEGIDYTLFDTPGQIPVEDEEGE